MGEFLLQYIAGNNTYCASHLLLQNTSNKLHLFSLFRPFNNPTETYRYYSLPFCHEHSSEAQEVEEAESENVATAARLLERQQGAIRHRQRLGESIVGDRRESSPYEVTFGDNVEWRLLCKEIMHEKSLKKFKDAIHNNYFFEMFVEDLPMWGYIGDVVDEDFLIGEVEGSKTFLFPHLHFKLGYNNDQVVSAKVTTDVSMRRKGYCVAREIAWCSYCNSDLYSFSILLLDKDGSPS